MLLVIGDSYACRVGRRCDLPAGVETCGWSGGRVTNDRFRRWAIAETMRLRPSRVLVIVGGNDLAQPEFSARMIMQVFEELVLGLCATGAHVHIFPVPPRLSCRRGAAPVPAYMRRRRLTNLLLRQRFNRQTADDTSFCVFNAAEGFIGSDGVHPSPAGWRAIAGVIDALIGLSPHM